MSGSESDCAPTPPSAPATRAQLEARLTANAYDFEAHCILIRLLRDKAHFNDLAAARERMAMLFALPADMWLQWIEDDGRMALQAAEKQRVLQLYRRAVHDAPASADLWQRWLDFVVDEWQLGPDLAPAERLFDSVEQAREIFEMATAALHYHVDTCHVAWHAWLSFEVELLESSSSSAESGPAAIARVDSLFKKLLYQPHVEHETSFDMYRSWIRTLLTEAEYDARVWQVKQGGLDQAVEKMTALSVLESELEQYGRTPEAFMYYLQRLEAEKCDKMFSLAVLQSALALHPTDTRLWTLYIDRSGAEKRQAVNDALKRIPWTLSLWVELIPLEESEGASPATIEQLLSSAMAACDATLRSDLESLVRLCLAYCDYYRRALQDPSVELEQVTQAFLYASECVKLYFADGDPYARIEKYFAEVLTRAASDVTMGRDIWNDILASRPTLSMLWLEAVDFEKKYDQENVAANGSVLYSRALTQKDAMKVLDWPEQILESWIVFEREYGTLASYFNAIASATRLHEQLRKRRETEAATLVEHQGKNAAKPIDGTPEAKEKKRPRVADEKKSSSANSAKKDKKRARTADEKLESAQKVKKQKGDKPQTEPAKQSLAEQPKKTSSATVDPTLAPFTVFVSNLSDNVTEEKLRAFFGEVGTVSGVSLIQDRKPGQEKNFAYVVFESIASVSIALAKDRTMQKWTDTERPRHMFISQYKPKGPAVAKVPENAVLDVLTLYVTGLPPTATEEELKNRFPSPDDVQEVRLIPRGKSPFAYVQFKSEGAARTGLQISGTAWDGHTVKAAISNRPVDLHVSKSLGFGKTHSTVGTAKRHMALSMVPTSVVRKKTSTAVTPSSTAPLTSNDDFRKFLRK